MWDNLHCMIEVQFETDKFNRLETDPKYTAGFSSSLISAYRMRLQMIRAAASQNDLYAMKCLAFERLDGNRSHQHALRLTDESYLVVELRGQSQEKVFWIVGIESYTK